MKSSLLGRNAYLGSFLEGPDRDSALADFERFVEAHPPPA